MLRMGLGTYWKFSWAIFIPIALTIIFIYYLVTFTNLKTDNGLVYPGQYLGKFDGNFYFIFMITSLFLRSAGGWVLAAFALVQLPLWAGYAVYITKGETLLKVSSGRLLVSSNHKVGNT